VSALLLAGCFDVPIVGGRCDAEHGCRADETCVEGFCRAPDEPDAGTPEQDGGYDGGLPVDGGPDAGADGGFDAGVDGGQDAGADGGQDAGVDGGQDAGVDGGGDAGFDGGYDAGQSACGTVDEECTPGGLSGETCWSLGRVLAGGSGPSCSAGCLIEGCGAVISDRPSLQQAVDEALATPQHEVIRLPAGTITMDGTSVSIDECGGGCGLDAGPLPYGVTVQGSAAGQTCLTGGGNKAIFEAISGRVEVRDLCFIDVRRAIFLKAGGVVDHCLFRNDTQAGGPLVELEGEATVTANRFEADVNLSAAVALAGADAVVAMNVFDGLYGDAVGDLGGAIQLAALSGTTHVDHNTIRVGANGVGVNATVDTFTLCLRNNVIVGDNGTSSEGVVFSNDNFGGSGECAGGVGTGANLNRDHDKACETNGNDCTTLCDGEGILCDVVVDPGLNADLCPDAAAQDIAVDLGYDLVDGDAATFNSSAPDLGARESGSTRSYGGEASTCP
jgi:hypothetical protein